MHTMSLEHVQLTNQLRACKRDVYGAAAKAFDRLRAEGGIDLEAAAELLSLHAAAQVVAYQREINHERLLEYLVNGMSLDGPGLPSPIGPISDGDRAFERLSAQLDRDLSQTVFMPDRATLRSVHRFKAWMATHLTCVLN